MRFALLIVLAATLASAHPAAAAGAPVGRQSSGSAGSIRPEAIYQQYCSVCHAERGDGRSRARASLVPPPRDFTDPAAREALSREQMIAIVRDGKPGTAMVGWKTQLTGTQIDAVVDYIRATFMATSKHATLPLPNGLAGNRARGARLYFANCAPCHGAKGDGEGARAYFINPRPRNFLDSQARASLNRPALFAAISMGKRGTEMPAWRTVFTEQQIADVAEFVFREFLHPDAESPSGRQR